MAAGGVVSHCCRLRCSRRRRCSRRIRFSILGGGGGAGARLIPYSEEQPVRIPCIPNQQVVGRHLEISHWVTIQLHNPNKLEHGAFLTGSAYLVTIIQLVLQVRGGRLRVASPWLLIAALFEDTASDLPIGKNTPGSTLQCLAEGTAARAQTRQVKLSVTKQNTLGIRNCAEPT